MCDYLREYIDKKFGKDYRIAPSGNVVYSISFEEESIQIYEIDEEDFLIWKRKIKLKTINDRQRIV